MTSLDGVNSYVRQEELLAAWPKATQSERRTIAHELCILAPPVESPRRFELVAQICATSSSSVVIEECRSLAVDRGEPLPLRVFTTAVVASYHRRMRMHSQAVAILEATRQDFDWNEVPVLIHLYAISHLGEGPEIASLGLPYAQRALEAMPENPGVLHAAAHFAIEVGNSSPSDLIQALSACDRALTYEARARYHYTRARILSELGRFEEAERAIQKAIDTEDRSPSDFDLRLTDYMLERNRIDVRRMVAEYQRRMVELETEQEKSRQALESESRALDKRFADRAKNLEDRMLEAEKSGIALISAFAGILAIIYVGVDKVSAADSAFDVLLQVGAFALVLATIFGLFLLLLTWRISRLHKQNHLKGVSPSDTWADGGSP